MSLPRLADPSSRPPLPALPSVAAGRPELTALTVTPIVDSRTEESIQDALEVSEQPTINRLHRVSTLAKHLLGGLSIDSVSAPIISEPLNKPTEELLTPGVIAAPSVILPKQRIKPVANSTPKLTKLVPNVPITARKLTANKPTAITVLPESTPTRERYHLNTALLVGGLALVGAKAYSKQGWHKIRAQRASLSLPSMPAVGVGLTKLKDNWRDAPLQAVTRSKTRLTELKEKGGDHKGLIAKAVGILVVSGLAYASYKGVHHHAEAATPSGPVTAPGPNALHHLARTPNNAVAPPTQAHHLATTPLTGKTPTEILTVHKGDGITNLISQSAQHNHVQLSGAQNYHYYQQLHAQFGDNLLNTDTYRLPNGDIGLRHAGQASWHPQVQAALEQMIKAAKKKKTLA